MKQNATPRPWSLDSSGAGLIGSDGTDIAFISGKGTKPTLDEANARLIVRAVNAHDAMKEALVMARGAILALTSLCESRGSGLYPKTTMERIESALSLANGAKGEA